MLKKSLEFAVSNEHENLWKNAESAHINGHCIAALAWVECVKHHQVLKIVTSAVYMVTQCHKYILYIVYNKVVQCTDDIL